MSRNIGERDITYDLLRSIVIINAIILHFDTKFNLSYAAYPFKMIQSCFFTVGAFFFFTAGVMAYAVYVPRFKKNNWGITKKLIFKGLKILAIYIFYLFIMKIALGIKFEGSLTDFLFRHGLFLKVLFTFGILYIIAPLFICFTEMNNKWLYTLLILTIFIQIFLENSVRVSDDIRMLLVDRRQFLYPLLPSLMMFLLGMIYSASEQYQEAISLKNSAIKINLFFVFVVVLIGLSIIGKINLDHDIFNNTFFVMIRELLVIIAAILFLRRMFNNNSSIYLKINDWRGMCFGVKSLTAYVAGNILIGLINYKIPLLGFKALILITVLWLTYLVSYWSWKADGASKFKLDDTKYKLYE